MSLYPDGTIRKIANQIEESIGGINCDSKSIILLRKGKRDSKNIFFIHTGTGNIDGYNKIINALEDDVNVWGIELDFKSVSEMESFQIKDLAYKYVNEIRDVVKERDEILLVGMCIGGILVYEVANQLEKLQIEIKGAYIISSVPPQKGLREKLAEIENVDLLINSMNKSSINMDQALSCLPNSIQWAVNVFEISDTTVLCKYLKAYKNLHLARVNYLPDFKLNVNATYIEPINNAFDGDKWGEYFSTPIKVFKIEGNHDIILQEGASKIAQIINKDIIGKSHDLRRCSRCTLPETYPRISFDDQGVCNYCHEHDEKGDIKERIFIDSEEVLIRELQKFKNKKGKYDVLVPLSGGVDSCSTLIRLKEYYNLRPLAFHNDHGYEDDVATENVKKVCKALDIDLIIKQQDLGFMKKFWRYTHRASVRGMSSCFACGGIIYSNSLDIADKYDIPLVINGYSKGQANMMDEKGEALESWVGLLNEYQKDPEFLKKFMEIQEPMKNQITFSGLKSLEHELPVGKHLVIPFYVFKFNKTEKKVLQEFCKKYFDWQPIPATYPNRSTNCEMVWLNTYVDQCRLGYSMYDEEYAGIVRSGDMTREQAIQDLEFNPPHGLVERLAKEIETNLTELDKI